MLSGLLSPLGIVRQQSVICPLHFYSNNHGNFLVGSSVLFLRLSKIEQIQKITWLINVLKLTFTLLASQVWRLIEMSVRDQDEVH